jgi:hypothetical protein
MNIRSAKSFDLWASQDVQAWRASLDRYDSVIAAQGSERLVALDHWYRTELPGAVQSRTPMHATLDDMVRLTEWKMARGVFRARNLVLVKGNDAKVVRDVSARALALTPHPTAVIKQLSDLDGVGPATASALAAAAYPAVYPFFDELVAWQIPGMADVTFTLAFYGKYAEALRTRAAQLGEEWTPVMAERALWSHSGGKIVLKTKQR